MQYLEALAENMASAMLRDLLVPEGPPAKSPPNQPAGKAEPPAAPKAEAAEGPRHRKAGGDEDTIRFSQHVAVTASQLVISEVKWWFTSGVTMDTATSSQ